MDTNDFKTKVGPEGEDLKTSVQGQIEDLRKPISKSVLKRLQAQGAPEVMPEGDDLSK